MSVQCLKITKIRLDGGTQSRLAVNPDIIKEYARLMRDGIELDPLDVFFDGENYWLADGFHRVHAARRIGIEVLNVNLHSGTIRDAVLFSCGANAAHGLRRTNADKRKAVETLLLDPEWSNWSNSEIARRCGVSLPTVNKYRIELEAASKPLTFSTPPATNGTHHAAENNQSLAATDGESPSFGTSVVPQFSSLIKPSDNWNFSPVFYQRIDENAEVGYIPGDVYVNAFWYYVKPGDLVVDPMAGSGMAQIVYNDRQTWMGDNLYDFDLRLYDLTPQQPFIEQHNLLVSFPVEYPDYIFIDVPYYDIVRGAYSAEVDDLANMDWSSYVEALHRIAQNCAVAQKTGKLCTIVSPNYVDWKQQARQIVPMKIVDTWCSSGYEIYDLAFATRRIQQTQTTRMAIMNKLAKENRMMLSDVSVIMSFVRNGK